VKNTKSNISAVEISQFRARNVFGSVLDFCAQTEATAQGYHKRQRSCVECSCSAFRLLLFSFSL